MFLSYDKYMILGIDEAGRGPWAGPLVVGAVVLGGQTIEGLTDSKKLSKKRREELSEEIHAKALAIGIGWAAPYEIDDIGLGPSLVLATRRAVEQVKVSYHEIIIDGTVNFLKDTGKGKYVTVMKKADLLVPSVSAASIVAKVARDQYMVEQDTAYPEYHFGRHSGYGTAVHRAAIEKHGVTPLHRLSFTPLQAYRQGLQSDVAQVGSKTTTAIGRLAEDHTCTYLEAQGHEILDRNWRTKFCEIDIVSKHQETVYFTEVKYRKDAAHGDGLSAVTPKKLQQMTFAAEYYIQAKKLTQNNRLLAAASLYGQPPELDQYLIIK